MSEPAVADHRGLVERVRRNLDIVHDRIQTAGGQPEATRIVAVTKGFGPEYVAAAMACGLVEIGENYAQELLEKARVLGARPASLDPHWHFVGSLQRNKVRLLAPLVSIFQSVDRLDLGETLARRAPGATVFVQVNLTNETQRGGCPIDATPRLVARLGELGLHVRGLMAVAPLASAEKVQEGFRAVRVLADKLELPERSYGMSDDLEIAVGEGATTVRLGTSLFGARPVRRRLRR
ncbi:MAG: YggS family pyridoxal phosphate-dependent enzyme [Acidimicrobiales bacterium]